MNAMKKGFTLVEMLVVIGILAILIGAGMTSFSSATKKAQRAKGMELVSNVKTAMEALYQKEGSWPRRILAAGGSDGKFDAKISYELARRNLISLTYDKDKKETSALDRFGIVDPWAQTVVRRMGNGGSTSAQVPSGGTLEDHILHFAIDDDDDGIVKASVGGEAVNIRGKVAVWGYGVKGAECPYSEGVRKDGLYSWSRDQVKK